MAFSWGDFLQYAGQGVETAGTTIGEGMRTAKTDAEKARQQKILDDIAKMQADEQKIKLAEAKRREELSGKAEAMRSSMDLSAPQLSSGMPPVMNVGGPQTPYNFGAEANKGKIEQARSLAPYSPGLGEIVKQQDIAAEQNRAQRELGEERAYEEGLTEEERAWKSKESELDRAERERHNKEMETIALAEKKTKDKSAMEGIDPDTGKPFTSVQSTNAGYALRAVKSSEITDRLYKEGFDAGKISNAVMKPEKLNYIKDPKQRQYAQAARDFVNSILRPESGAVIAEEEFKNAYLQYFPQPGDDPDTQEQKRINRLSKIAGLKATAGNAYQRTEDEYNKLLGGGVSGKTKTGNSFTVVE